MKKSSSCACPLRRKAPRATEVSFFGRLLVSGLLFAGAVAQAAEPVVPIDATGLRAELDARKGRVVLVNFWATWCRPCLQEIPDLMSLQAEFGDHGFDLVAVSLDDPGATDSQVRPFLEKWFPEFTTFVSLERSMDGIVSVIDPFWNELLPTSYLLDRNGAVAVRKQGGSSAEEFATSIRPLLAARAEIAE